MLSFLMAQKRQRNRQPHKISFARHLRRNMSDAERKLWRHLRDPDVFTFRFRRQHPVGKYIVDFVCLDRNLVIEFDGGQHDSDDASEKARTEFLESLGFEVLRFWNNEVLQETEAVVLKIKDMLIRESAPSTRPSPQRGEGDVLEARFIELAFANEKNAALFERLTASDLEGWVLVSGCLFQSVWNGLTDQTPECGIKDYDVFYFDGKDLIWEAEDACIRALNALTADLGIEVELRNQARVHLWYQEKFGAP